MLVTDRGVVHVRAKKPGVVMKKFVNQNDYVKKGQILYLISTEQDTLSGNGVFKQQINILEQKIKIQKNRLYLLKQKLKTYDKLLREKLTTKAEYQKYYDDYLTAQLGMEDLKKNLSQLIRESEYTVQAPHDGIISALIAKAGERVAAEKLLISIVPNESRLQGELFIPSQAIGFIEVGQKVLLRYKAYPYQSFGLYESNIISIDKSILSAQDLNLPFTINEPFYRATVELKQQHVIAYGKKHSLVAGMLLDAVVLLEKKKLWQWIMNPLYSLKGSLE